MPESRGRKPKKQRQVATQTGESKTLTVQEITAAPNRRWAKVFRIFTIFAGAVGLFAGAVGLLTEWPRPTIEVTNAPEASNPFSGIFKVANTRFYPLEDVRI